MFKWKSISRADLGGLASPVITWKRTIDGLRESSTARARFKNSQLESALNIAVLDTVQA
jgi:hypothetical protein